LVSDKDYTEDDNVTCLAINISKILERFCLFNCAIWYSPLIYAISLGLTIFQVSYIRRSILIQKAIGITITIQNLYNNSHSKEYLKMTVDNPVISIYF
jgi:hypothetical protein